MSAKKVVWVWRPGETEPVPVASISAAAESYTFQYDAEYVANRGASAKSIPLDPVELRLRSEAFTTAGLPGVCHDAKPAGFGEDCLNARLRAKYGRTLTEIELLEEGPADGAGAIELCHDIERKLDWRATPVDQFKHQLSALEKGAPASKALRRSTREEGTSAGGERPKGTLTDRGRLWIVKIQERGDREGLPAMEYTAMTLAAEAEITVPEVDLISVGPHQAFMVERYDRAGDPAKPMRHLFASARTVMQLEPGSVRGDPKRSYLHLADRLRVWGRFDRQTAEINIQELWKRMAFNGLVGNIDDHPLNHGVLFKNGSWQLSPAFDLTPITKRSSFGEADVFRWPFLAMATSMDGRTCSDPLTLLSSAEHFGLDVQHAASYLLKTSAMVASTWERVLRDALDPLHETKPEGYVGSVVDSVRSAFGASHRLAESPEIVLQALEHIRKPKLGRRRIRP